MSPSRSKLAVEVDGKPLEEEEAREVWRRFSEFCENGGTPAKFAEQEEVASVLPTVKTGVPTLVVTSKPNTGI
jgi:hypothetical protein